MSVRETIKKQIMGALKDASFPIETREALLAAFPQGAATTCKAGNLEMTAGEAGKLLTADNFPFNSSEEVAETILSKAGL